jgi:hypothetical protein
MAVTFRSRMIYVRLAILDAASTVPGAVDW